MLLFAASDKAACKVTGSRLSFFVFGKERVPDEWMLLSHPEETMVSKVISWPGEYDFGGMIVRGIGQKEGRQVSYTCEQDGVRFAFIDAPVADWSDEDIQSMGDVDVLVIAADDAKKVQKVVEEIDPRVVMLFDGGKGNDMAAVAKACGSGAETVSEFKVKAGSLPAETRQVVILAGTEE